jgi:hypothetical protein
MPDFTAVAEQFRKLSCAHCHKAFTPEAVTPLRQEADYWVVRVVCTACNHPSGVAVVGAEPGYEAAPAPKAAEPKKVAGIFASRREEKRFAELPPISADEVLDASRAIRALGADWARLLKNR